MKTTIFGFLLVLSTVLPVAFGDTKAEVGGQQLGQSKGRDVLQTIKFTNSLIIPFSLLPKSEQNKIDHAQDDLDKMLTVVFIDGQIVRAGDILSVESRDAQTSDYRKAIQVVNPSGVILSSNMDTLDVNYCKASVILSGKKNSEGYILAVTRDTHPFAESRSRMSITFGDLVETKYSLYVDLAPEERPNEFTIRSKSKEMPSISCVRHSKSGDGTRVQDFVTAVGANNVEVQ